MRSNPEDKLQKAVIKYFRYQHPRALIFHCPNGGQRNKIEGAKFKEMGVTAGIPDLIIPDWMTVIELKSEKGKLQESQRKILSHFKDIGWSTYICYSFDEAKEAIEQAHSKYVKQKQVA